MKKFFTFLLLCAAFGALYASDVKSGDSVAFMGDSITNQGWGTPSGYVRLIEAAFKANDLNVTLHPAGIGGHKSNDMLNRLDKDVISKKPTFMTLSCGVNDVWHGARGIPLDAYKKNITEIVDKAQAAGIKVVILTATMISEDPDGSNNKKLAPYNDFLRELAKEKNCKLADLNADMVKQVSDFRAKTGKTYNIMTYDGVHMDYPGNKLMAEGVLRALGFSDAEMAKAQAAFETLQCEILSRPRISVKAYLKLKAEADAAGLPIMSVINSKLEK